MASINWKKQTNQTAGAMIRHLSKQGRIENNHSNKDIDISKSRMNYYIGCSDYTEALKSMRKRVAEVDKTDPPKKKVKNRVVCCSLEAKCPDAIYQQGLSQEFFQAVYKVYEDFFGKENVHGSCIHLDEMHSYIDNGVEKMSLAHSQTLVSAYVEWTEKNKKTGEVVARRGINGKNFETKARLNALNKAVCDMVKERFGVEYNTGEKARHKTVEQLKAEGELAKAKQRTDDFVRSLEPTPTKKVKTLFGEKETEKTPAELQRDREILAAQSILRREQELTVREKESKARETALNDLQAELSMKTEQHNERVRHHDREVAVRAERLCKEQLARSEKYQAFREYRSIAARWRSKLEEIFKLAYERSKNYVDSLAGRHKDNRSAAVKKTVDRSK